MPAGQNAFQHARFVDTIQYIAQAQTCWVYDTCVSHVVEDAEPCRLDWWFGQQHVELAINELLLWLELWWIGRLDLFQARAFRKDMWYNDGRIQQDRVFFY